MNAVDSKPSWAPKPYTQNQANLINTMMKERGISAEQLRKVFPTRPSSAAEASKVIEWLKSQQVAVTVTEKYAGVSPLPESGKPHSFHYALEQDGEVKFYRVKRGRRVGVWFVDVQASDDYYPIRNPSGREAILEAIALDPKAALARYGQLIGRCGRCGKTLTSEYRELGIGPVCIDK
jgi:hypothetical protein